LSYIGARRPPRCTITAPIYDRRTLASQAFVMAKYGVGWMFGLPVYVVVIAYFYFR